MQERRRSTSKRWNAHGGQQKSGEEHGLKTRGEEGLGHRLGIQEVEAKAGRVFGAGSEVMG